MGWLSDALFGEPQQTRDKRETIRAVIDRNFRRAGVSMDEAGRNSLAENIMAGQWDSPEVRQFEALVFVGQPDNAGQYDDATDILIYGKTPKELQAAMFDGYQGRGWSKQDLAARKPLPPAWMRAGPKDFESAYKDDGPQPFEMSEGSRQAYEWDSDRELLDELKRLQKDKSVFATPGIGVDAAVDRWKSKQNQTYGTSGWIGAMENPEYLFGHFNNHVLSPAPNALKYQSRGERESGDDRGVLGRLLDKFNNEATDYRDMANHWNKVSPVLPGDPKTWQEKDAIYRGGKQMVENARPMAYDLHYKKGTGEYPSYYGSGLREFSEDIVDPTTALSLGYGAVANSLLKETAKGAAKQAGKAWMAREAAKSMSKELLAEELPMYAGTNVLLGQHFKQQANEQAGPGNEPFNSNPGWIESAIPGNEARKDMYVRDPVTGNFRPETPEEFEARYQNDAQSRQQAFDQWRQQKGQFPKSPVAGLTE